MDVRIKRIVQYAIVLWGALVELTPALSQALQEPPPRNGNDVIAGLLVNQTVSALGLVFFREFADAWRDRPDAESYTLTIVEKPSRRLGNQILIMNGQQRVLVLALPIRYDRVAPLAGQAAEASYGNLISLAIPFLGGVDPDLGADEI